MAEQYEVSVVNGRIAAVKVDGEWLRIISFGAGVQSTCMLFMGLEGLFGEPPDAAVFADTGWEPAQVYAHLEWVKTQVDIPIYVVSNGRNLYDDTFTGFNHSGKPFTDIPTFVLKADGKVGIGTRQCTRDYKIRPIHRQIREIAGRKKGAKKGVRVEQWIGISTDEAVRIPVDSQSLAPD